MTGSYWIQNSDYSNPTGLSESEPVRGVSQLMNVIGSYDWAKENAYEAKCLEKSEDCCPAGMGIVTRPGVILHICPNAAEQTAEIYLHREAFRKFLGVFKWPTTDLSSFNKVPMDKLEPAIKAFLVDDYEHVLKALKGHES